MTTRRIPRTESATEVRRAFQRLEDSLNQIGLEDLSAPDADRIIFWDDSEGAAKWLTVSTGLQIDGTNLKTKDTEIVHDDLSGFVENEHIDHSGVSIAAGTGLTGGGTIAANRTLALSHLGIESLAGPGADRIFFWDETESAAKWLELGADLTITDTTLSVVAGGVDHGSLAGLGDDDHTQYLLADGTRDLTGNLAVDALITIDGRDLSVDGAKLDGIEALADVTDAVNVAAAGATMGGAPAFQYQFLQGTGAGTLAWTLTPTLGGDLDVKAQKIYTTIANGNIIIAPDGTGALIADTYGNARGTYATDLQKSHTAVTQVASGTYTVIGGGLANTASGNVSAILGGRQNTTASTYSVICGGYLNNAATGDYCTIVGGRSNTSNSGYGFIGGGFTNSIGTTSLYAMLNGGRENTIGNASQYAVICGGCSNSATGEGSGITGGTSNTVVGAQSYISGGNFGSIESLYCYIGGGRSNAISTSSDYGSIGAGYDNDILTGNTYGVIGGGYANVVNSQFGTIPGGKQAKTTIFGQKAFASGNLAAVGDAQVSVLVARASTADAVTTVYLTPDGASSRLTLADGDSWLFVIHVVARKISDGTSCGYEAKGVIERTGAATTLVEQGTTDWGPASTPFGTCVISADDVNEALQIAVTGIAAETVYWVARVELTQVNG